jgi:hypothetical protein
LKRLTKAAGLNETSEDLRRATMIDRTEVVMQPEKTACGCTKKQLAYRFFKKQFKHKGPGGEMPNRPFKFYILLP